MIETRKMQEACLMEPTVQWSQHRAARSTILRTIITDEPLEKVPISYSAAEKLNLEIELLLYPDPHAHKHPASTSRLGKKP